MMNSNHLWGRGSGMAVGIDMAKRPDYTTVISLPTRLSFEDLSAEQQSKVVESVNNMNAAGACTSIDAVMDIVNKFSPPAPVDELVQKMIADVHANTAKIVAAARKRRNQRKRERRARRVKQ